MAERRFGGLVDALRRYFAGEKDEESSRNVAEEIHKELPERFSARKAIEEKRRRMKKLDEILED